VLLIVYPFHFDSPVDALFFIKTGGMLKNPINKSINAHIFETTNFQLSTIISFSHV